VRAVGRTSWAIAGGHVPLRSHGPEPQMTSHEALCLLNASDDEARVEITIFHGARDPVGPYRLTVPARRTRRVRLNDLIDPEALPLDEDYAGLIESDIPIVVQFAGLDSGRAENARFRTTAFPVEDQGG
jgi:hypothetical protein